MSSCCKQCSIVMFGKDSKDFANLSDEQDTAAGFYPIVLCEGCGPTEVNHLGECIVDDCLVDHTTGKLR